MASGVTLIRLRLVLGLNEALDATSESSIIYILTRVFKHVS